MEFLAPFAELLGSLAAVFAVFALILARFGYKHTLGLLIQLLEGVFLDVTIPLIGDKPFKFIASALATLDDTILRYFADAIGASENAFHQWWQALGSTVDYIAQALAWDMGEVLKGFQSLRRDVLPRLTKTTVEYITHPIKASVGALNQDVAVGKRLLEQSLSADQRALQVTEAAVAARLTRLEALVGQSATATARGVPQAVAKAAEAAGTVVEPTFPNVLPQIHGLEAEWHNLQERVTGFAKKFTVAGIIGLVGATIFTKFGLNWLRCRGVNRLGNSLCGLGGLIEELLAASLLALSWGNVCEILTLAIGYVEDAKPVFEFLADEFESILGCQNADRAPPLAVTSAALPPAQPYASLPTVA